MKKSSSEMKKDFKFNICISYDFRFWPLASMFRMKHENKLKAQYQGFDTNSTKSMRFQKPMANGQKHSLPK